MPLSPEGYLSRPLFTAPVVTVWCKRHAHEHRAPNGEIDHNALARACAEAFKVAHAGGPLHDPDHWLWEAVNDAT